jgi:hypothetical protein
MFQRKTRRFRRHPNGRNQMSHRGSDQIRPRSNSYSNSNGQNRNSFRPSLSPEKLFEKYSALAKEAMSSGDKTLSENYLQHADHFMRVIEDKNKNRNLNKPNDIVKPVEDKKIPALEEIKK